MKGTSDLIKEDWKGSPSKPLNDQVRRYSGSKEAISSKYAVMREQSKQSSNAMPAEDRTSAKVSLLEAGSSTSVQTGLASKWASMKAGFQTFKANMEAKKFLPLRPHVEETKLLHRESSTESLDQIFQRLKRPTLRGEHNDEEEDE